MAMATIRHMYPLEMARPIGDSEYVGMTRYRNTEIYEDHVHQQKKIQELEKQLEVKKTERKKSLQNLIAYYYKK